MLYETPVGSKWSDATIVAVPVPQTTLDRLTALGAGGAVVYLAGGNIPQDVANFVVTECKRILVPQVVSMAQARKALINAGVFSDVDTAILAMAGTPGELARADWEYQVHVRRNSDLVQSMIAQLGWADDFVDDLFIAANGLD